MMEGIQKGVRATTRLPTTKHKIKWTTHGKIFLRISLPKKGAASFDILSINQIINHERAAAKIISILPSKSYAGNLNGKK